MQNDGSIKTIRVCLKGISYNCIMYASYSFKGWRIVVSVKYTNRHTSLQERSPSLLLSRESLCNSNAKNSYNDCGCNGGVLCYNDITWNTRCVISHYLSRLHCTFATVVILLCNPMEINLIEWDVRRLAQLGLEMILSKTLAVICVLTLSGLV